MDATQEKVTVQDKNGKPIGIGDNVQISADERGIVRGIAFYDNEAPQLYVDYMCGDGCRVKSWWTAEHVNVV